LLCVVDFVTTHDSGAQPTPAFSIDIRTSVCSMIQRSREVQIAQVRVLGAMTPSPTPHCTTSSHGACGPFQCLRACVWLIMSMCDSMTCSASPLRAVQDYVLWHVVAACGQMLERAKQSDLRRHLAVWCWCMHTMLNGRESGCRLLWNGRWSVLRLGC